MAFLGKAVAPLVMAGAGVALAIVAPSGSVQKATPDAWIDSPVTGVMGKPGPVTVVAHGTAGARLSSLSLKVDGKSVATNSSLKRTGLLFYATFTWQALAGEHSLEVTGAGVTSVAHDVLIGSGPAVVTLPFPTSAPRVTAHPTPSATVSASASPTASPTASATASVTTSPTAVRTTAPPVTPSPTPKPKPTRTTAPKPTVGTPSADPTFITASGEDCAHDHAATSSTLTVSTTNASKVVLTFTSESHRAKTKTLTLDRQGSTWFGTITDAELQAVDSSQDTYGKSGTTDAGVIWDISAVVTGPGGTAQSAGHGTLFSSYGCVKP